MPEGLVRSELCMFRIKFSVNNIESNVCLSFSTYQKKVIPEIDTQERIETEVNRQVAQIHESYEARLRALEERLGSSNAQVSVNNIVDILIFLESNHCTLNITN